MLCGYIGVTTDGISIIKQRFLSRSRAISLGDNACSLGEAGALQLGFDFQPEVRFQPYGRFIQWRGIVRQQS